MVSGIYIYDCVKSGLTDGNNPGDIYSMKSIWNGVLRVGRGSGDLAYQLFPSFDIS